MKKLFISLVALAAAAMSYAQNTLVATLSHGENITMYYGTYALRDAHNAAQSGDVINLSGGAFQAVNITKALTLRGTGIDDASPTYISGNYTINVPSTDANRLSMEGIRNTGTITMKGTFNSPYFLKSQFYRFEYDSNAAIKNAMFANCRIANEYYLKGTSTVQFLGSYVSGFCNNNQNNTAAAFINCVIMPYDKGGSYTSSRAGIDYIVNSQILNSIIFWSKNTATQSGQFPISTIVNKCVSIGGFSNPFGAQAANTGNKTATFAGLFKTFTGTYSESEQFELTDEAKTTYLGNDGKEVGMHGGVLPYDTTPSYPQITKMNVANKTTADGKLSVEIEVSAAE